MIKAIRTIIAEDHKIYVEGLKSILNKNQVEIVEVDYDGQLLIEKLKLKRPDILLLDLNLPGKNGFDLLRQIKQEGIGVKVIILTMYGDPKIVKAALNNGAQGFLLKDQDIDELPQAIVCVHAGGQYIGQGVTKNGSTNGQKIPKKVKYFKDGFTRKQYLTKRELEILNLITQAMSNKEIAKELYISDQTVSVHRKNIMRKLGVSNTAGLLKVAYEESLI